MIKIHPALPVLRKSRLLKARTNYKVGSPGHLWSQCHISHETCKVHLSRGECIYLDKNLAIREGQA